MDDETPDMALMRNEDLTALVTEARRAGMAAGYQEGVRDGLRQAAALCIQRGKDCGNDRGGHAACVWCAASIEVLVREVQPYTGLSPQGKPD